MRRLGRSVFTPPISLPVACARSPAVHFLLIGAVLFGLDRSRPMPPPADAPAPVRKPIVITAAQIETIRTGFIQRTGVPPSPADEAALIDAAVEEELLYREALARGLDRGDRSIRWRLAQKMRFLSDDPTRDVADLHRRALELGLDRDDVVIRRLLIQKMRLVATLGVKSEELSDAELQNYLRRHADRFRQPGTVSLSHVFFSAEKRGEAVADAARALLQRLRSQSVSVDAARRLGDAFPLGHHFDAHSQHQLAKMLGGDFARAAMALTPGQWSEPVRSAYGVHLVWVHASTPPRLPALAAVRGQVTQALLAERRAKRLAETLQRLRTQYGVRVERTAAAPSGNA